MGGSGAYMVTKPGHRPLSEADLNEGVGIDMFNWDHRYAVKYSIEWIVHRQAHNITNPINQKIRAVSHISKHVYVVFDGNSLVGKENTKKKRSVDIRKRMKELQGLVQQVSGVSNESDIGKKTKKLCATVSQHISWELLVKIRDGIESLHLDNVTILVAPFEADQQLL